MSAADSVGGNAPELAGGGSSSGAYNITSDVSLLLDMCIDKEGNLWLADTGGLYNYYGLNFKNYDTKEDVYSILIDDRNNLWFPVSAGNLIRIGNEKQERMKYPVAPSGFDHFNESSTVRGNNLYFTNTGILHYNTATNRFRRLNVPEISYTYSLALSDDSLFVGDLYSAFIYDLQTNEVKRQFSTDDFGQTVIAAATDGKGKIFLCGANGLSIIEGDTVRKVFDDRLLYSRNPLMDPSGRLWMTCQNRLVTFENDTVSVLHTFPQNIRGFYITRKGIVVVATINSLWLSESVENLNFMRYDKDNGFDALDVVETPLAEDKDGTVYLSVSEKVICFNPRNLLSQQLAPRLHILSLQVSSDNVIWRETGDNEWKTIRHNENNLRFNFTGLSFSAADRVRYHYRLHGFQNEWSEPMRSREVTFNNLPPGDYMFEIYADAGTNDSRSEILSVAFSIRPAIWQTAWFTTGCIILLILTSAGVALYFQRRRNRVLMEKLRAEKELNELRISSIRLKAIPHFNANVLSAIEYYITNRTKEEAMHILGIYSDFTFKTLNDVDKAARPLCEELAYVKMYLDLEKIRFMDKFDFHIDVDKDVDENVQLPNKILHTYCENAVKHGLMPLKSGGMLTIRVTQHGQSVCVSVEDNGVGRARAEQNTHIHSTKQGLSILNRQIEIYNRFNREKINRQTEDLFKDRKPNGTRFTVEVPVGFSYIN